MAKTPLPTLHRESSAGEAAFQAAELKVLTVKTGTESMQTA